MGFFHRLKIKLNLERDYNSIFVPFFNGIKSALTKPVYIEQSIPLNVAKVYDNIKNSKNRKYTAAVIQFDKLAEIINKHNAEIEEIIKGSAEFSKTEVLNNPFSYDVDKLEKYHDIAVRLSNYKDLTPAQESFKDDVSVVYENLETIRRQKELYDAKKSIRDRINNFDVYLDDDFCRPLALRYDQINNELRSSNKLFYDFDIHSNLKELIGKHNREFIENNKKNHLFDDINGRSLDDEQREAVLTDELSTLVIAGAGSGKTLTICGKVKYLLNEKKVQGEDILLLSYSKKSADDLQKKMSLIDGKLTVGTFHKIGLDVLKETHNKVFVVEDQYKAIIERYFREEIKRNPYMLRIILAYYGQYVASDRHNRKYKNEGEMFEDLKKQDFTTLKARLVNLSNDVSRRETLKKEHVKSFQEMAIANWYFINGIDYIYEFPYEKDTSTADKRQYLPDFYLPKYKIYHEHYGINREGKAEQFEGQEAQMYVQNMEWKRSIHSQYQTKCLETYSYEFDDGSVFDKLEKELKENGVEIHPLSDSEILNALESIYEGRSFKSFINLISTFLSLYKARFENEFGFEELAGFSVGNAYERERARLFLIIVKDVYLYYMNCLRSNGKIDFDDMILKSMRELEGTDSFKYKYVIVDEFQDISFSRMQFLKTLISHGHSKLFAVGDDWQAIYRFSGCDLNIFLNFAEYFGASAITKITTTHRNSQELQDIAGPFIKANPEQFNKRISSVKHLDNPVRIVYSSEKKYYAFMDVLKEISKIDANANVLILGRNNKDFESISMDGKIYKDFKESNETKTVVRVRDYPSMKFSYSTVHGSKGLEEDYVIIINADDSRLGFPNKTEDDELLDMVLSSKSGYEYAEERRLWYVALTRTRNYTYIIADKENPSVFVKEIEKQCLILNPDAKMTHEDEIMCPKCKSGRLLLRVNKADGSRFYGCSNYPYCDYSINDTKAVSMNKRCRKCGDFMVYRKGPLGAFYGCHNYPRCDYTEKYVSKKQKSTHL